MGLIVPRPDHAEVFRSIAPTLDALRPFRGGYIAWSSPVWHGRGSPALAVDWSLLLELDWRTGDGDREYV